MRGLQVPRQSVRPVDLGEHISFELSAASSTGTSVSLAADSFSGTEKREHAGEQPRLDQAWFWTPRWQEMEREVNEDLAAGRYDDFDTIDDLIRDLEDSIDE